MNKRFSLAILIVILGSTTGCVLNSAQTRHSSEASGNDGLTAEFRACYDESKRPWLVAVVAGRNAPESELERLLTDFVGPSPNDIARARSNLASWRAGRFSDAESMAASMFDACMNRRSASRRHPGRSTSCYKEQKFAFMASDMRYEQKIPQEEATGLLLREYIASGTAVHNAIRRVVRDTYLLSKSAGDPAYFEAQFHACMNLYTF